MGLRRFFVNNIPFVKGGSILISGQQHTHLKKSLRLNVGNQIEIFNDNGQTGQAVITEIGKDKTIVKFYDLNNSDSNNKISQDSNNIDENKNIEENSNSSELYKDYYKFNYNQNIDVATSLPKSSGKRNEWLIEKLAEIGVDNLLLIETEYSKSSPASQSLTDNKLERFDKKIIESAKQSRNNNLLKISPPKSFNQFVQDKFNPDKIKQSKYSHIFLFDPNGKPIPIIFDEIKQQQQQQQEKEKEQKKKKLKEEDEEVLCNRDMLLFIGPEGGFTKKEIAFLKQTIDKRNDCNLYMPKLGNTILRMETAAIVTSNLLSLYLPYLFNNKK